MVTGTARRCPNCWELLVELDGEVYDEDGPLDRPHACESSDDA